MKALKWMSIAFMSAMLCFGLSACSNNDDVTTPEDTPAKEYLVSIGFKGEITISEAPLSRASGNDLYGIQVYSRPASDETSEYTPYAYGLFDDLSAMTIKLIEGYKYRFVSTMVVDGKEKIYHDINDGDYFAPFRPSLTDDTKVRNGFLYSRNQTIVSDDGLGGITWGYSALSTSTVSSTQSFLRPNLDRYYGEHTNYTPSENGNVSIDMLRTVFGLKVIANNLTEGTIKIDMEEAPEMNITHPANEVEDIFTFYYVDKAYSTTDYSETISTTFTWTKVDGATIPLGTYDITFKRNKQTIVTIEIDEAIEDASVQKTLGLSLESEVMSEGDSYTIKGDESTDNTVTPGTDE